MISGRSEYTNDRYTRVDTQTSHDAVKRCNEMDYLKAYAVVSVVMGMLYALHANVRGLPDHETTEASGMKRYGYVARRRLSVLEFLFAWVVFTVVWPFMLIRKAL